MKKYFVFILTAATLLLALAVPVCAAQPLPPIEDVIVNACIYGQEADISEYAITSEELGVLYADLFSRGKLPWYADAEFQYTYNDKTGLVGLFQPETNTASRVDMAAYEQAVAQILAEQIHDGMTDWQIALVLHDYLIVNGAYDDSLAKTTCYDFLVNGTAVCSGYTSAYQDLMLRAGIECRYVISEKMDHAWNQVKIGGKWYHVDLTWDDPSPDSPGFVDHTYFLLTDEELSTGKKPHYDWDSDIPCTDTRFSQGFWKDVTSPIVFESANTCYLMRFEDWAGRLCRRDIPTGAETTIYAEEKTSLDIGYGEYNYEHHGLTLRGGRLWFCTVSTVCSIKPDGTDLQTHYTNTTNTYIYSFHAGETVLQLSLTTHSGKSSLHTVVLAPTGEHVHYFKLTVTAPTCQEPGYTTSICDCGLECISTPVATLPHDYVQAEKTSPTLFRDGYTIYVCEDCGHSHTEALPRYNLLLTLAENIHVVYFFSGAVTVGVAVIAVVCVLLRRKRQ